MMKGKGLQPGLLYPAKLSFRMEGEIKCFLDKVKRKELIITKPMLCEMLKGLIKKKKEIKTMNIKMIRNSEQSTTKKQKQTEQTTGAGTQS